MAASPDVVLGYDDSPLAEHARPPLTSVRLPIEEMCAAACRLLIEGQTETSPPEVLFPNTLVVRQSYGAQLTDKQSPAGPAPAG